MSMNSEAVSQAGAAIQAEGGSVLPQVTASQKIVMQSTMQKDAVFIGSDCIDSYFDALSAL